ncbi:glycoside hydrolase family 15 protein [Poseidonocella sp. HB161398]|uniref:glycoside hydrolase family 15 protein n=1 Tax=Poseidonocella sp. HB161398 TaxID=2320855 RepID=UPI001109E788|nr:glycoside hydrolase family 15 protein [Poseidonocella sp. HB161398]
MADEKFGAANRIATAQRAAAASMARACSATGLVQRREGFGWTVRPAPGSVLASTHPGHWDPEPDYFHHWIRDAAIVARAMPLAMAVDGDRQGWLARLRDYIAFSLAISDPARRGPPANPLRAGTRADHLQFLRPDAELAALHGTAWLEEPRCAADGGPDLERWARPQDDGPALRAQSLMELLEALPELEGTAAEELLARDLSHLMAVAGRPAIGPWEEEPARRCSFTLVAQWDALDRGAARTGDPAMAARAAELLALIAGAEDPDGALRESLEAGLGRYDIGTVMAILDAGRWEGPLALDGRWMTATVAALEAVFAEIYPLNRGRAVPAMGRWREDVFFDGNPWFPCTLACAELDYRLAARHLDPARFARGEARMEMVLDLWPGRGTGGLPEQFDRATGAPRSCPELTWSAAAFLSAAAARARADQALGER